MSLKSVHSSICPGESTDKTLYIMTDGINHPQDVSTSFRCHRSVADIPRRLRDASVEIRQDGRGGRSGPPSEVGFQNGRRFLGVVFVDVEKQILWRMISAKMFHFSERFWSYNALMVH